MLFYTEEDGRSHSERLNKFTTRTVVQMRGRLTSVQRHRHAITFTRAVNKYQGQPDIGNSNRGIRKMLVDYNDVHASSHAVSKAHILQRRRWDATYFKILNSRGVQTSLNSFPLRHVAVLHC